MNNYYNILGIEKNASSQQIKKAYRSLAHKFHPDKHLGDKSFEVIFKEINQAYEVLSDSEKKKEYDLAYQKFSKSQKEEEKNNGLSPNSIYDQFQSIAKIFHIYGKERIDSYKAFKSLSTLLSDEIISYLQGYGKVQSNKVIIRDIISCFKHLPYPYSEFISIRLAKLAGNDNAIIKEIYSAMKIEKYRSYIERYGLLIVVGVIGLLIFIVIQIDACT